MRARQKALNAPHSRNKSNRQSLTEPIRASLRQNQAQFQAILDNSPALIFVKDSEGRYLEINRQFEKCLRLRREQIIGKTDTEIFPDWEAEAFRVNDLKVIASGSPMEFEEVGRYHDGTHISIVYKFPLRDATGKIYAIGGIGTDITQRKGAEKALRESEERFRATFAGAAVGMAMTDLNGRFVEVNSAYCAITGYTEQDLLTLDFPSITHPEDRPRNLELIRQLLAAEIPSFVINKRYIKKDGSTVWVQNSVSSIRNAEGQPVNMIALTEDITKRKLAEAELGASREQLRALAAYLQSVREEERIRIARELHDEIGQALTGIKLVLERTIREQSASVQANLTQALGVANELIGRVRDLSLELRPPMLDDLGLLAALRWHFERYTAQFNINIDFKHAGLERHRFQPEIETAAYRIVQEALTNVARHAKVNRVEVGVEADENMLRILVKDLGNGFDISSLPGSRTGGLSGMRERASMLGGRLVLDSAPGAGTLLTIELPL